MKKYHSQFGEDQWLVENVKMPDRGFFVDVGASDGIYLSNTFYFEQNGWDGVCFEPNPKSYRRAYGVRNKVYPYCIGLENKSVQFNMDIAESDLSTLLDHKRQYQQVEVEMRRLDAVMSELNITKIDLLSIDTEGTEIDVLNSFDIGKVLPTIIIVEYFNQHSVNDYLKEYFAGLPYKLIHITTANYIYQLN